MLDVCLLKFEVPR